MLPYVAIVFIHLKAEISPLNLPWHGELARRELKSMQVHDVIIKTKG
jgi:hypothetical protein